MSSERVRDTHVPERHTRHGNHEPSAVRRRRTAQVPLVFEPTGTASPGTTSPGDGQMSDPTPTSTAEPDAGEPLATEGSWVLEAGTVDAADLSLVDGGMVTLVPVDGELVGRAACNEYGAAYCIEGATIEIGLTGQTEMACDERRMGVEA